MTLLPTAIVCVLTGISLVLLAMAEHLRGKKPTWLFTMAIVLCVAGIVMGGIYFFRA